MSIQNINNIKSINHYQIKLDNEEKMARLCLEGKCGHGTEDRCAQKIATEGWHECVEEKRLLTVGEYMTLAPSVAEEFVKLWLKENSGVCSRIMADNLRAKVAALKASDSLGILTMFAFIVGNPADDALRTEFYRFLNDEEDDAGPVVTDGNFYWELEKSMSAFADLKKAQTAWASRTTANAGPNCDQCGNARTGIGGRVCELCDLAKQDTAIVHNHVICHCCVDDQEDYDYDDGNQPPRWKDAARRTYDDGFDEDYDGEDEDEETASQEEERRQEMVEENERQGMDERQMEAGYGYEYCNRCGKTLTRCWCDRSAAYLTGEQADEREAENELNRAVFEHNSVSTSDPHIRISHLSPVVPDNWQEIVNRVPSCAGCKCDCRDNMSLGCCGHVCPTCRNKGEWIEA